MNDIASWVRWGGIILTAGVAVVLMFSASRQSRPRRVRPTAVILVALVQAAGAAALIGLTGVRLNALWMGGMALAGLAAGWFAGRGTRVAFKDGVRIAKLSAVATWVLAGLYTGALAALFLADVSWFVLASQAVVFAQAMVLGSAVSSVVRIAQARPAAMVSAESSAAAPSGA